MIEGRDDYAARFAEAVVQEIWTQMGRQRVKSLRALALATGMSHQYVTARLKVDPKTGKPVVINVRDLAAFGIALEVEPTELLRRAREAVGAPPSQVDMVWADLDRSNVGSVSEIASPKAARNPGRPGSKSREGEDD